MSPTRMLSVSLALVLGLVTLACSSPNGDDRTATRVPDRTSFPPVSDLLDHRCGSFDCHGSTARNLRLYGHEGLRLDPAGRPSSNPNTTSAEYDASFLSIVTLEPELMSAVVAEGGVSPERLTFVRKARGTEHHKGGTLMNEGDPQDRCITEWLAGRADAALCTRALAQ